jgi:hypothetical protein
MATPPYPLEGNPEQPGWYAVIRSIPEDSFLCSDYWDGSKWRGGSEWYDRVLSYYPQRYETEAQADLWVDIEDKKSLATIRARWEAEK